MTTTAAAGAVGNMDGAEESVEATTGEERGRKRGSSGGGPSRSKKRNTSSAEETKKESLLQDVVSGLTCAITHEPVADPVLAEDGFLYERSEITRWFSKEKRSPRTNKEMGTTLMASVTSRQLIEKVVSLGLVDDEAAASWHVKSGKLKARRTLPGGASAALNHFKQALKLNVPNESIKLLVEATELRVKVDDFLKRAESANVDVSCLGLAWKVEQKEAVMTEWRPLVPHVSRIRIIDNLAEFERLCNRPAPGASTEVMFTDDMEEMRGNTYTLENNNDAEKSYDLNGFSVPYDACVLVSE